MHFASQFQIITMNEGINQSFFYGTLWVLWVFKAIVRSLTPSLLGVTAHKVKTSL